MMAVHLNTSFLIRAGSVEDGTLRDWLSRRTDVGISVIASAEFFCGLLPDDGRAAARRLVESPVPFVEGDAIRVPEVDFLGYTGKFRFAIRVKDHRNRESEVEFRVSIVNVW